MRLDIVSSTIVKESMAAKYVPPNDEDDSKGYEEWLSGLDLTSSNGSPFMYSKKYPNDSGYYPDEILNDNFLSGIEEQKDADGFLNQTYKAVFENEAYGKCDGNLWVNGPPKWGSKDSSCDVLEDKISHADDSATEFVLKTCRFTPLPFPEKIYAQIDGHMTDIDLTRLCEIGQSFKKEIQNNTRSLSYMNSNFDPDPNMSKTGLQSPLLLLYGQNRIDEAVRYPMVGADVSLDKASFDSDACTQSISKRDETVKAQSTQVRNTFVDPSSTDDIKKTSLLAAKTLIKEANRKVASVCFPNYNKSGDPDSTSLKLDTIAGNIFQIATLPLSEYEELKQWQEMSDANDKEFREKGLASFSDSRCRNARSIGYHLCRNLPSAVITEKQFDDLTRSCGYSVTNPPPDTFKTSDLRTKLRTLKPKWSEDIEEAVVNLPSRIARFGGQCATAKNDRFIPLLRNVRDRLSNPALGSVDDSCGALKAPMACGEFTEGVDLPRAPDFAESPETKIRSYVYDALLGGLSQNENCAIQEVKKPFTKACSTYFINTTESKELQKLLLNTELQQKLASVYKFKLDAEDFSEDCKKISNDAGKMECHIFSKIVPEVCESAENAESVCAGFRG